MQYSNIKACVFDAFGTLFNLSIPLDKIHELAGDKSSELLRIWRTKQLEYTWLRNSMKAYTPFSQVTKDALTFAMKVTGVTDSSLYKILLPVYHTPVAFPEVMKMLSQLKTKGMITAILSNGTMDMLESGVQNSGLSGMIDYILSVDKIKMYKPRPEIYQMALDDLNLKKNKVMFFSSNTWDVAGAANFGLPTIWINRDGKEKDELPGEATGMIKSHIEIPGLFY